MAFKGWNYRSNNNKYGARTSYTGGVRNDSTNEGYRKMLLKYREQQHEISGLRFQVSFELIPHLTKVVPRQLKTKIRYDTIVLEQRAVYTCDFIYKERGKYIMEEFKSEMTAKLKDYVLRRKLILQKIKAHNAKGRSIWVFREVIYTKKGTTTRDIEP